MSHLQVSFPRPCGEKWQSMTPSGCHRTCGKCDNVVHDLTQYKVSEVEVLLREEPNSCVRALIDPSGMIVTKPETQNNLRRIMAVIGASTSLLISQPVAARDMRHGGAIVGQAFTFGFKTNVLAKDAMGNVFRSTVRSNGHYKIKNIPPGSYTLEFIPGCGDRWTIENIIVADGQVSVPDSPYNGGCIIVGRIETQDYNG